ncbi:MAG: hypothetical protein K6T31_09825, partial [Alicyclobacillus sp.]|nr:hypothetical protein [Alicyclobacillus sp.]
MNVTIKSLGALAVAVSAYINQTFSPLFWALLALAAVDILLNVHREGQQFQKLGSAFAAVGGTTVLSQHIASPDILKIAVAVLTLAYLQVVVPQLVGLLGKIRLSSNPTVDTAE